MTNKPANDDHIERLTYSIMELAKMWGVGHATIRKDIRAGKIPSFKVGNRILIPRVAIEKIMKGEK